MPPAACVAPGPRVTMQMPGPAGELAVGVGHVRGADLVAAGDEADRRVVERVEHRQVALAGHAERDVDPVDARAGRRGACRPSSRQAQRVLEEDGGLLELRPILVGRIDVADRALPRPLGGQDQHADERRRLVRATPRRAPGRGRTRTMLHQARTTRCALGVDVDRAVEQVADARPRMGVACRRCRPAGSRCGRTAPPIRRTGRAGSRRESSAPSASSAVSSSCQTSACPSTCASP